MSQKRQPEEGERPRWGGCGGGGPAGSGGGSSPGEPKRQRVPALREVITEVMRKSSNEKLFSSIEPLIRRVVSRASTNLPTTSGPSATIAGGDERLPVITGGGLGDTDTGPHPDRCEALAAAIAGVLGGALEEHEARAAATTQSQAELATAIDRLNGELDKLLENAPSPVIAQHAAITKHLPGFILLFGCFKVHFLSKKRALTRVLSLSTRIPESTTMRTQLFVPLKNQQVQVLMRTCPTM